VADAKNVQFSVVDGFSKRPGSKYKATITGLTASADYKLHPINRDDIEKYIVLYGNGIMRVFDTSGVEQTVTIDTDAQAYIDQDSAQDAGAAPGDIIMSTVADFTIVGNKNVVMQSQTSDNFAVTTEHNDYEAMIATSPSAGGPANDGVKSYHRTKAEGSGYPAGYFQYIGTGNGTGVFAKWYGDYIVGDARNVSWWQAGARNDMAMRIVCEDHTGAEVVFDASIDLTSATDMDDVASTIQTTLDPGGIGLLVSYENVGGGQYRFVITSPFDGAGSPLDVSDTVFTGSGLDDFNVRINQDTDVRSVFGEYEVEIDATGTPDTYKISANGVEISTGNPIPDLLWNQMPVVSGFQIQFDTGTTGHTLGEKWTFRAGGLPARIHPPADSVDFPADFKIARQNPFQHNGRATTEDGRGTPSVEADFASPPSSQATGGGASAIEDRWVRVTVPGQEGAKFDETTMPHKLVRSVPPVVLDGSSEVAEFTLESIDWTSRFTGTNVTNPAPTLFQQEPTDPPKKLADISFLRNRLVLAAGESVVLSQAGDYFNFYIEDAANVVDSDPIDAGLSTDRVTLIDNLVTFQKTIVIFTKAGVQFELNSPEALTPSTVAVTKTTEFESLVGVHPATMRNQIYFPSTTTAYGILREYFFVENQAAFTSADVTAHVPNLLPTNIKSVVASPNNNTVLVLPRDGYKLWVYRAWWRGEQKVQSAWALYEFDSTDRIVDVCVLDDDAYLLIELDTGDYVLDSLKLNPESADTGMPASVHLDRSQELTGSYNAGANETTWDWGHDDPTIGRVVLGASFTDPGTSLVLTNVTGSTGKATGDYSGGTAYVGRDFTQEVTLSRPYAKDDQDSAIIDARYQLRKLTLNHKDSVYYKIQVEQPSRDTRSTGLVNYQVNVDAVGDFPLDAEGTLSTFVMGNAAEVTVKVINDAPFPATITGGEWLVELTTRSV
jgi:hypothetical protein